MKRIVLTAALAATFAGLASCKKGEEKKSIKVSGSNTMAQVATAWAENFTSAKVSVAGGGSGIGINELTEGRIDICTSSRPMKASPNSGSVLMSTSRPCRMCEGAAWADISRMVHGEAMTDAGPPR